MANNLIIRTSALPKFLTNDLQAWLGTLDLRLSTVNATPNPALGNGQFTEVTDSGYAPINQTWGAPFLNGSNQGETDAALGSWTFDHNAGDFTVYVQYWTDPLDSDAWVMAAKSTAPFVCTAPGQIMQAVNVVLCDQLP